MNTLNERLERLEKLNNSKPIEPSFIIDIHDKEENIKQRHKMLTYNEIKNKYINDINNFFSNQLKELTNIIEHTVYFVEIYTSVISSLFNVIVKGDSKLSVALVLIGLVIDLCKFVFESDFIQ